eukprot:jgi/Undpi1/9592/HiC_scaffold_27.g12048.m1
MSTSSSSASPSSCGEGGGGRRNIWSEENEREELKPSSHIALMYYRDDSESLSLSTTATSARSPSPSPTSPARGMERRGSRARRRLLSGLTVDTALGGFGVGEEEDPPAVIDTTSVEVERKADGSVAKLNEYVIVRDLGQGSSAEVKLCRLVLPPLTAKRRGGSGDGGGSSFNWGGCRADGGDTAYGSPCDSPRCGQGKGRGEDGLDCNSDLYAVKIFDRAEMMRRGARFARPRARGPDGVLLVTSAVAENFAKVQREIAIMKKLVHPNIVQLVEVIDAPLDSSLYMVMEYVERGAVMRCVEPARGRYASPKTGGCLDAPTAARYFVDILTGLEFLHLQLIAHRDLKPENVLVGDDDRAKIADFGVSQYFTDEELRTPKSARSLARSNSRAQMSSAEGTWCFWAPEMCGTRGEGVAFNAYAADAWAAGVTLWCFLHGTVPLFSPNPMDLFDSIANDPAPIPEGTDDVLRDLFARILDKDPRKRLTVPEARDHPWVLSQLSRAASGDGDTSPFYATGDSSSVGGGGNGGGGEAEKVAVSDEDIRSAVTQAFSSVVVTKIKGRVNDMKLKARRISTEFGTSVATTASLDSGSSRTSFAGRRKSAFWAASAGRGRGDEAAGKTRRRYSRRPSSTACVLS